MFFPPSRLPVALIAIHAREVAVGAKTDCADRDDPGNAAIVQQLQKTLEQRQSFLTNFERAKNHLSEVDSTLGDLNYDYSIKTANGEARVASVKLASVSVAGARVEDVDAVVMEGGLESSLLGMTYLGRLSRFEATPTALILRP